MVFEPNNAAAQIGAPAAIGTPIPNSKPEKPPTTASGIPVSIIYSEL